MTGASSGSPLDPSLLQRAATLSSATLHEAAGRIGALPSSIRPLVAAQRVCGPAYTVSTPPGDNLWLHHAILAARRGDVIVASTGGAEEFGYWGEVMAVAAQQRGIAGLVIAGGVRDSVRMIEMGFPVFATRACVRGTGKNPDANGTLGTTIRLGDVDIAPGDLIFGDADGVVAIPAARAEAAIAGSEERDGAEVGYFERLRAGETTVGIYGLPPVKGGER